MSAVAAARRARTGADRVQVVRSASAGRPMTVWAVEALGHDLAQRLADDVAAAVPLTGPIRWVSYSPAAGAHTCPGTAGVGYMVGEL